MLPDLGDYADEAVILSVGTTYTLTEDLDDLGGWFGFFAEADSVYTVIVTTGDDALRRGLYINDPTSWHSAMGVSWPTGSEVFPAVGSVDIYDPVTGFDGFHDRITVDTAGPENAFYQLGVFGLDDFDGWVVSYAGALDRLIAAAGGSVAGDARYSYAITVVQGDGTDFVRDDWGDDAATAADIPRAAAASLTSPDIRIDGEIEVFDYADADRRDVDVFRVTLRAGFEYDIHVGSRSGAHTGSALEVIDVDVNVASSLPGGGIGYWLGSGRYEPLGIGAQGGVATAGVSLATDPAWQPGEEVEVYISVTSDVTEGDPTRSVGGYEIWITPEDDRGGNRLTPDVIERPGRRTGHIDDVGSNTDNLNTMFGEEDWYRIEGGIIGGYTYVATVTSDSDDLTALSVALHDGTGGMMRVPEQGFLVHRARDTQTAFLAVEATFGGQTGDYTLELGQYAGKVRIFDGLNAENASGTARTDLFYLGGGNDTARGFAGNDEIHGQGGADLLIGNQGADTLTGGAGQDTLSGGDGTDSLRGGSGADRLFGNGGVDRLFAEAGNDTASGGAGRDTVNGGAGHDRLLGGDGADVLSGEGGADTLFGGRGDDRLYGGDLSDRLVGNGGDDLANGGRGDDTLLGGDGADTLGGAAGADSLAGGRNDDRLAGGNGNDALLGGDGDDTLLGMRDRDRLDGGAGDDLIDGAGGADSILAGDGADTVLAGAGDDLIVWRSDDRLADRIDGGEGTDLLRLLLTPDQAGDPDLADDMARWALAQTVQGGTEFTFAALPLVLSDVERIELVTGATGPVAAHDAIALTETGTVQRLTGNVLANDVAADPLAPLSVRRVAGAADNVGTVIDGAYGSFTIARDGSYAYALPFDTAAVQALAQGQVVTDRVWYAAGAGDQTRSAALTVTITGTNDAPLLAEAALRVSEDAAGVSLDLTTLGDDPDADDGPQTLGYTSAFAPDIGTRTLIDTVLHFAPGAASQSLAVGQTRDVEIPIRAHDSHGAVASSTVTVTIEGRNDAPAVIASTMQVSDRDGAAVFYLSTAASDIDSDDTGASLQYEITSAPAMGRAGISGTELTFDPGTDFAALTASDVSEVQIGIRATDSHGATGTGTITVAVRGGNDAPVFPDGTLRATEDGAPVTLALADLVSDPDSDDSGATLRYGLLRQPEEGSARIEDGVLTFDPGSDFQDLSDGETRDITLEIEARDRWNDTAQGTVTVTVEGRVDRVVPATLGALLTGSVAGGALGAEVTLAGDVDGDGLGDLLVGAPRAPRMADAAGGLAYLVSGAAGGIASGPLTTDTARTVFSGPAALGDIGIRLAGGADVTGDGIDDFAIGIPVTGGGSGEVRVMAGQPGGGASGLVSVLDADAFVITGDSGGDRFGEAFDFVGDVNGDGYADLAIGREHPAPQGADTSGRVDVVFGGATVPGTTVSVSDLDGGNGFSASGLAPYDHLGSGLSPAGDVNGDGIDDLLIGASSAPGGGAAYVIFGRADGFAASVDLAALNGSDGFVIGAADPGDHLAQAVAGGGDLDGDGFDDLVVGAPYADSLTQYATGEAFILFGRADGWAPSVTASGAYSQDTLLITGAAGGDRVGAQLRHVGDVSGDGYDDLLIGVPDAGVGGLDEAGEAWLILGGRRGAIASGSGDLDGTTGFRFVGAEGGARTGASISPAGDVDGDGIVDLLIGAPGLTTEAGAGAGGVFLVRGGIDALSRFDAADGAADGTIQLSILGEEAFLI